MLPLFASSCHLDRGQYYLYDYCGCTTVASICGANVVHELCCVVCVYHCGGRLEGIGRSGGGIFSLGRIDASVAIKDLSTPVWTTHSRCIAKNQVSLLKDVWVGLLRGVVAHSWARAGEWSVPFGGGSSAARWTNEEYTHVSGA